MDLWICGAEELKLQSLLEEALELKEFRVEARAEELKLPKRNS